MTEEWQGHRCNAISGDGVISQVWRVGEGFKEKRYSTCSLRDVTLTVRRGLRCWEPGYRMNDYGWAWGSWPRGGEVEHRGTGTGCSVIGQRWAPEGDWNEPGFCDKGGDNQFLPRAQHVLQMFTWRFPVIWIRREENQMKERRGRSLCYQNVSSRKENGLCLVHTQCNM